MGVALTAEGVSVACVVRSGGVPHLSHCAFQPVGDLAGQRPALVQLVDELGLKATPAVGVMPAGGFTLLLINAPEVPPDELRAAVRWRVRDLIDFHVDDAVIDVFDIPGQQERGRPKMMYVVAAHRSRVQEHIDNIEASGLALDAVDIPELAQRNIAALLHEDANGTAFLHLERTGGLLTLTREGTLFLARNLDVGVEHLAPEAGGGTADEPAPGLRQRLDQIVLECQRSFDYYESHFALAPISTLVMAPTSEDIPGMLNYLASQLGIAVRMLDLNTVVELDGELDQRQQSACLPAIGAALRTAEAGL